MGFKHSQKTFRWTNYFDEPNIERLLLFNFLMKMVWKVHVLFIFIIYLLSTTLATKWERSVPKCSPLLKKFSATFEKSSGVFRHLATVDKTDGRVAARMFVFVISRNVREIFSFVRVEFIQTVENSMIQIWVLSEKYKLINLPCNRKITQWKNEKIHRNDEI